MMLDVSLFVSGSGPDMLNAHRNIKCQRQGYNHAGLKDASSMKMINLQGAKIKNMTSCPDGTPPTSEAGRRRGQSEVHPGGVGWTET